MYDRNYSFIFEDQLGVEFEADMCEAARSYFVATEKNMTSKVFQSVHGTARDKYEGVDAIIYGIPVDFTTNFSNKDHMDKLDLQFSGRYTSIKLGVRYGNSHHGFTRFKEPVLVIGVDEDNSFVRGYMANIIDDFKRCLKVIIEEGSSAYFDWCDASPIYG